MTMVTGTDGVIRDTYSEVLAAMEEQAAAYLALGEARLRHRRALERLTAARTAHWAEAPLQ